MCRYCLIFIIHRLPYNSFTAVVVHMEVFFLYQKCFYSKVFSEKTIFYIIYILFIYSICKVIL